MDDATNEHELIRKLVTTCHLNVAERKQLPGGIAKANLMLDTIEDELRRGGRFPAGLRPTDDFSGGLIERCDGGHCRIYWKSEFSMLRYELDAICEHATPRDAARAYLRAMFPNDIDGIRIDWQS